MIPGGCTSVLQPLDVCLNKPFKVNIRRKWNEWMIAGDKQLTKAGYLKRPALATVCQWVIDAWNEIPTDMVIRSFLKCGISNSIDGTEDDELFGEFVGGRRDLVPEYTDVDDGRYDDGLTEEEFDQLYGHSDDEDFDGFNMYNNH